MFRFFLIISWLILFGTQASAAARLGLELGPKDAVRASVVSVKSVRHRVLVEKESLSVSTLWQLQAPAVSAPEALYFGSIYKSKRVKAVRIDGKPSKFALDGDGILQVEIESWPRAVEIQYELLEAKTDRLLEVEAREFFALLPYVQGDHGYGFDIRPKQSLNFSEVIRTSAEVRKSGDLIVYGSAPTIRGTASMVIAPREVGRFVLGFANPDVYSVNVFSSVDTGFLILSPKKVSGFDAKKFRDVIEKGWPMYRAIFPSPSNWIVLHNDPSMPVGAGPIGSNVFGFGYSDSVSPEVQQFLLDQAGWPKANSSNEYIRYLIPSSPDPVGDYWTMIINHELGHLFFGLGLTTERRASGYDFWMSLGLGLAVDEILTRRITGRPVEFYDGLVSYWQIHLAHLPIDQRLESPDTSADEANHVSEFNRVQHFAHGKSLHFWRMIREKLGEERFLGLMKAFVERGGFSGGYLEFRPILLQELPELPAMERQQEIF